MKLTEVEINNFRTLNGFKMEEIDSLHVITGTNNSGKSNFLRALDLFFNHSIDGEVYNRKRDMPYHVVFGTMSGGSKTQITITLCFHKEEMDSLLQSKHDSFKAKYIIEKDGEFYLKIRKNFMENTEGVTVNEVVFNQSNIQFDVSPGSDEKKALKIVFDRIKYFYLPSNADTEELIKDFLVEEILSLSFDAFGKSGEHKENIVKTRKTFKEFQEQTNELLKVSSDQLTVFLSEILKSTPGLMANIPIENWKIKIELPEESKILDAIKSVSSFRLEDGVKKMSITSKGSGLQKTTAIILMEYIMTAINKSSRSTKPLFIWGVDEPEGNLQPGLQKTIYQRLKKLATGQQIILATHSPNFVDLYESSKDISLFDLSAELTEARGRLFYSKKTNIINEKHHKSEFFKNVKEHLGVSLFDTWHIMKGNYLFEGESDKQYILSMYNYLTGKSIKGSLLISKGAGNTPAYTRLIDDLSSESGGKVGLKILLDYDTEGKPLKDKIKAKTYSNLDTKIIYTKTLYFSEMNDSMNTEIEDMVIPEIYWESVSQYLQKQKSIPFEKIPTFSDFFESRKKFSKDKMTDFLDSWFYAKLEGKVDRGVMKQEDVKMHISFLYSKLLSKMPLEKKTFYLEKYPVISSFLEELE